MPSFTNALVFVRGLSNLVSRAFMNVFHMFVQSKIAIAVAVAVVLAGGYYFLTHRTVIPQFVSVTRGSIAETVSVTGNTASLHNVVLGFGESGTIAHVYSSVGQRVNAGQLLAELDAGDAYSQVEQARATLAKAKSATVVSGITLESAKSSLVSAEDAAHNTIETAYATVDDAVHKKADETFSNPNSPQPMFFVSASNTQLVLYANASRLAIQPILVREVSALPVVGNDDALVAELQALSSETSKIHDFLGTVSAALGSAISSVSVTDTNIATYRTDINTALNNINALRTTIASGIENLNLKRGAVLAAEENLSSGAGENADVLIAEAGLDGALAQLQKTIIRAPITGVVTGFDAKVGQFATPGATLISIISDSSFEVDAGVPETDVGKISVGDKVTMSLDAFPNETFKGTLFYINPAETVTQGVVDYKIKVSFDSLDTRIKSGLTANLTVETRHKDAVLILPQYAVLQNDKGTFVEIQKNGVSTTTPITLGIQDQNGNVEITSGVTEGERVLTIGLK